MKFRKNYKSTLLLFYIIVSYAAVPFFLELGDQNQPLNQDTQYPSNLMGLEGINANRDEASQPSEGILWDKHTKYDEELTDYLKELKIDQDTCESEDINIIFMFDDQVSKIERLNVLQSHFTDFEVIYNYEIIPGVYARMDPYELIEAQDGISEITSIKKVYKSKTFTQPVISKDVETTSMDSISPSALDKGDYSNWWLSAIGAEGLTYDGSDVKIAIIDSGVYDHPGLTIADNISVLSDDTSTKDRNGHGTHCAGIAAGNGAGSGGKYKGVAPGAEILNVRAADGYGALRDGEIIAGIDKANDSGADIISMSFGGGQPAAHDPITAAINEAVDNGRICVVSAGNSGPEYFTGGSPAAGTDAIAVGATNKYDELASFSSWGPTYTYLGYPDVVAPGVDIISSEAKDSVISGESRYVGDYFDFEDDADYIPLSGTSMSCPMVAGALAILKDYNSSITPETARVALLEGARALSDSEDNELLKSGAGLINVSASVEFLKQKETTGDINDLAKVYPSVLPVEPYDLLSFPGDHQQFNLTLSSGSNRTYDIEIPTVNGITLNVDNTSISFSNHDVDFFTLDIEIDNSANPGLRDFQINITSEDNLYDVINVSFEVKLPEYRVLMDSFHGLNDWLPRTSFYQMDFYDSMKTMASQNVSLEYNAVSWTPNYQEGFNNSLLTEERLGQYDLVVLQNPILPYNAREMSALKTYFTSGGNLLFLGTRSEELCKDNINDLFSDLGTGIQIVDKNMIDDEWLGLGSSVSPQSVTDLNHGEIFSGVNKFVWRSGTALSTSGDADSIASLDSETIAASYDGSGSGNGKVVAFGDPYWLGQYYDLSDYESQHTQLLKNLLGYYQNDTDVSVQIGLESQQTATGDLDLAIYAKNTTNNALISNEILQSNLSVAIENSTFTEKIGMTSSQDGIALNNTYSITYPSNVPYTIEANLTINSTTYRATSKLIYYDGSLMPKIQGLEIASPNSANITRASADNVEIKAELDKSHTDNLNAYLGLYASSFSNNEQTQNRTITLDEEDSGTYTGSFNPPYSVPSGTGFVYISPNSTSGNYQNAFVPRVNFYIYNNPPEFDENDSSFSINSGNEVFFSDTVNDEGQSTLYEVLQEGVINFKISVEDSVSYEDDPDDMRVFVNLLICTTFSIDEDSTGISPIYPSAFVVSEIEYNSDSNQHEGSLTVPKEIGYSTMSGTEKVSTETDIQNGGSYLGLLYLSVYDNEGGVDQFTIFIVINESQDTDDWLLWIMLIAIVAIIALIVIAVVVSKRRKEKGY